MSVSKKLYRQIADSIAADIDSGRYKPGDRLPTERDLAVQFGVSRPTLREALIALEILGMIEAKHGLGILVTENKGKAAPISDSEIGAFELIEARRLFEGEVAAMAATLVHDDQIAELEKLVLSMDDPDPAKAEAADREFHISIANITGNGAMVACVENLWDWRYRSPLAKAILARAADLGMKQRIDEHTGIMNALKARSSVQARQAMHDHMDRVIDHLLNATEVLAVENAKQACHDRRKAMSRRFKALSASG
ncbi:FadR/GntR family transcriptional regulator [Asticcacaulis sp. AC402]|uniref:FadR/GntR family transcriptional regulator n=1 Tax=Asticcacaulis sp. AC402 TaxID=1282361 RepID=UPI0003C3E921|nr:FadR/GntR family transcriptional regulator [Asticcacaulis sp. AC402]ESQ77707.1 GntR family transcriptional regulator [Asticcacaulis sp. AC402]